MELDNLRNSLWTLEAQITLGIWRVFGDYGYNRCGFGDGAEPTLFTIDEVLEKLNGLKGRMPSTKFRLVSSDEPLWAKNISFRDLEKFCAG